jgi:dTDP-4-amino-4,6-dideoxygalactose transaminase
MKRKKTSYKTEKYIPRVGGEFEIRMEDLILPGFDGIGIGGAHSIQRHYLDFDTGRSALYAALQNIMHRNGQRVAWLPAYTCNSVILPFQKCGFDIRFYSMGEDLQSPDKLPDKLDKETFLFIHYFGLINKPVIEWLTEMRKSHNFFVIEDCVQALFSENAGQYGDYVINSYRKFLPLPDGAMLCSRFPFTCVDRAQPDEGFISRRLMGKILRQYAADELAFMDLFNEAENIIDKSIIPREMSWISKYLLKRIDMAAVSQKRRSNWLRLNKLLETEIFKAYAVQALFSALTEGEVPMGMPIIVGNGQRDKLRQYLISKNIFCPVHWPLLNKVYSNMEIQGETNLSNSMLTLPIDQRIDQNQLEYMTEQIRAFYSQNN